MPKASSKKPISATKSNTGVNARASRQVERDRVRGAAKLSMKQSEYQDLLFIVCGLLCNSAARQKVAAMLAKQHSQQMIHGLFQVIMVFTILNLSTLLGTKQDARYDSIDQVFVDLGYGYEEEPFFGDDDEDQEENQGVDVAENQEEELNIPQGDEQFFLTSNRKPMMRKYALKNSVKRMKGLTTLRLMESGNRLRQEGQAEE